jgi:zinc transport system substrate-binding protein
MRAIMVLILFGGLATASCGGSGDSAASGRSTPVVAAFYPLAFAAEQIGGRQVDVTNLTPPGTEPHDVELSARDVERVRSAEVVLYIGSGFQPALEEALDGSQATTVDLLEGLRLRKESDQEEDLDVDPHVWLDPLRYAEMSDRIGRALGRAEQAAKFRAQLESLDREFKKALSQCRRHEIVTSHAAFGYLAERYELEQIAITGLSPEAEPTPRELEDVVENVREHGATTVFFETLVSPRLAETVARETAATTAVLNPLEGLTEEEAARGENYFSLMRANLKTLRKALECG